MAKDILLGGAYVASADGTGKTGLTVTIDVWRVAIADLAKSEIVTAGSASEIGDGVYCYRVASADLQTYYYFGVLKTSDTSVVQKHVFAVNLDYADSPGLVTLIWNALTSGMSTAGSIGKRITDYLTGVVSTLTAAQVWAYATRALTTGAITATSLTATRLTIYRGTTWAIALTDMGAVTGYSKIYFTVKAHPNDADTKALVQIEIAGGLSRLNGAAYGTAADGAITVDDAATGDVTITLKPAASAKLATATNLYFDVKYIVSGVVTVGAAGFLTISPDITKAVS